MVDAFPRDALLRYRWAEGLDTAMLIVRYVSRGAPDDTAVVNGSEITQLGRGTFSIGDTAIPYHRIIDIADGDRVVFSKAAPKAK